MNIYQNYSIKINQAIKEANSAKDYHQVDRAIRRLERAFSSFCHDSDAATQEQRDIAHYKYTATLEWLRRSYDKQRYGL